MTAAGRDRTAMPPAPLVDLASFPRKALDANRRWWRNHGRAGAWFFASGTGGRFDLDPPSGTLYLATTADAAARERIGIDHVRAGVVSAGEVDGRFLSELVLPVTVEAAHAATIEGQRWGVVPGELSSTSDYALTRTWARAFAAAGFTAIWSMLRFSAPHGRGLAVFGDSGPRSWPAPADPLPLRSFVETRMKLTVLDPPHSSTLTVLA